MSKKETTVVEQVTETVDPTTNYKIKDLMDTLKTKSSVIRHLSSEGLTRGQIVKVFKDGNVKMRYQHVRNVLITPLKKVD